MGRNRAFAELCALSIGIILTAAVPAAAIEPGPPDDDAPAEFTQTRSGLKYRILRKGKGERPNAEATVTVHYKGWLDDGEEFESSYKSGKPISFSWSQIVETWTDVMQYVSEGGMIELEIPSALATEPKDCPARSPPTRRCTC
ncbi:MAG: FKBP-type peptidyl-prolyl cis-trans isomerase [Planctomycetaceae bacterium]